MARRGIEIVTIRRNMPGGPDDDFYGDTDDNLAGVAILDGCTVWPRASGSSSERGVTTLAGLHIHVPPDGITWDPAIDVQELLPQDQVTVRGKEWMLDGAVGDWRKRSGQHKGYIFEVKRWAG